jgi:hypothetical protein
MRLDLDVPKPEIKVFYNGTDETSICYITEILLGIEEEGVPFLLQHYDMDDCVELAYQGAEESNLRVGLGITDQKAALHYNKLEPNSPLYVINLKSDENVLRALGANAARLVKCLPFKPIN